MRTEESRERNSRVQARWDELMAEGKHGHYETLFRIVREEIERERLEKSPARGLVHALMMKKSCWE